MAPQRTCREVGPRPVFPNLDGRNGRAGNMAYRQEGRRRRGAVLAGASIRHRCRVRCSVSLGRIFLSARALLLVAKLRLEGVVPHGASPFPGAASTMARIASLSGFPRRGHASTTRASNRRSGSERGGGSGAPCDTMQDTGPATASFSVKVRSVRALPPEPNKGLNLNGLRPFPFFGSMPCRHPL